MPMIRELAPLSRLRKAWRFAIAQMVLMGFLLGVLFGSMLKTWIDENRGTQLPVWAVAEGFCRP